MGTSGRDGSSVSGPRQVAKFSSFEAADEADREQYRAMTAEERLEIISVLRAMAHGPDDASAPRLERVLRITELEQS